MRRAGWRIGCREGGDDRFDLEATASSTTNCSERLRRRFTLRPRRQEEAATRSPSPCASSKQRRFRHDPPGEARRRVDLFAREYQRPV